MHRGEALTDLDRAPWIVAVRGVVEAMISSGVDGVVACSALKKAYREGIVGDSDPTLVRFVYLKGSKELISQRLAGRVGHFMNPECCGVSSILWRSLMSVMRLLWVSRRLLKRLWGRSGCDWGGKLIEGFGT